MKCYSNQSLFTQCSLHSLTVFFRFSQFSVPPFKIHYKTRAAVCQKILKTTVQCPAIIMLWKSSPPQSMTQRVAGVYFLRADAKLSIYNFTCWLTLTHHAVFKLETPNKNPHSFEILVLTSAALLCARNFWGVLTSHFHILLMRCSLCCCSQN